MPKVLSTNSYDNSPSPQKFGLGDRSHKIIYRCLLGRVINLVDSVDKKDRLSRTPEFAQQDGRIGANIENVSVSAPTARMDAPVLKNKNWPGASTFFGERLEQR
jgi:hypothetical protein